MYWIEIIKQISIIICTWCGIYGIHAWRKEYIGKRQIELAEDTLVLFYEAIDAITYMRHPVSSSHETEKIERGKDESDQQYQARKNASVVFLRYNQYKELFSKIHASRYRFMAQIGKTKVTPFDDLREIINEIQISASMLARLWPKENFRTNEQRKENYEQTNKYEAVFWEGIKKDDPIIQKTDKLITDIEKTCQSIISGVGIKKPNIEDKCDTTKG